MATNQHGIHAAALVRRPSFINGDVEIASGDIIRTHQPQGLTLPHVVRLEHELVSNCVIKIHGKPIVRADWDPNSEGGKHAIISIGLYHNALEHILKPSFGETVMEIDFLAENDQGSQYFTEGIRLFASYRTSENGKKELVKMYNDAHSEKLLDWSNLTFVEIRVFKDHFDIVTDHKPGWNVTSTNHLPLWAAEYLTVKGMLTLDKDIEFSGCS